MLIQYKDINPVRRKSYITWALIIINVSLFLTYGLPSIGSDELYLDLDIVWNNWGLFPNPNDRLDIWPGLFSHMFIHGGALHLGINMLMLYIFGNNLEDVLGHFKYLLYYILCGFAGGLVFALTENDPSIPAGGSSGAIAGLMGGYLLLFPKVRIFSLLILPNIIWPFSILIRLIWKHPIWGYWPLLFLTFGVPAWAFLGFWFAFNIWGAYLSNTFSNIAYTIHLGGFIAGMALIFLPPFSAHKSIQTDQETNPDSDLDTIASSRPIGPWDRPVSDKDENWIDSTKDLKESVSLQSDNLEIIPIDQPKLKKSSSDRQQASSKTESKSPLNIPPVKWMR